MKFTLLSALALAFATLSPGAFAQSSYIAIEKRLTPEQLRSVGLTREQIDQLDRMLREAHERQGASAVANASVPSVTNDAGAARRDDDGRDETTLIGFSDKPIESRLKGSVSGWEPGTVFELENGQRWKVLKGALKLPATLESPEIVVVPGIAGRWFLQVVEELPKARVYRID